MLSYCLRCTKKADGKKLRAGNTNKGKLIILSKYGLLSGLGIKTTLIKITLVGPLLCLKCI